MDFTKYRRELHRLGVGMISNYEGLQEICYQPEVPNEQKNDELSQGWCVE